MKIHPENTNRYFCIRQKGAKNVRWNIKVRLAPNPVVRLVFLQECNNPSAENVFIFLEWYGTKKGIENDQVYTKVETQTGKVLVSVYIYTWHGSHSSTFPGADVFLTWSVNGCRYLLEKFACPEKDFSSKSVLFTVERSQLSYFFCCVLTGSYVQLTFISTWDCS